MKQQILVAALLAVLVAWTPVASTPAYSVTPPEAPEGFAWQEMLEISGFVLVPDEWRFRISKQEAKLAYFITRDPITTEGFDTGITINVIRALPANLGVSPTAFARDIVMQIENAEQVEQSWTERGDVLAEFGVEWIDREQADWVRNHHRLLANDRTGTLYHMQFKTPAESWPETWPLAQTVLAQILLDGSI